MQLTPHPQIIIQKRMSLLFFKTLERKILNKHHVYTPTKIIKKKFINFSFFPHNRKIDKMGVGGGFNFGSRP